MKRIVRTAVAACAVVLPPALAALDVSPVGAQSRGNSAPEPGFAVSSVRRNVSGSNSVMIAAPPGGQFRATNVPLRLLIKNAYNVQDYQILNGPDWIDSDRYDVLAKADSDTSQATTSILLRSLLAEHFNLAVRDEQRQLAIYALVRARKDGRPGPALVPSSVDCDAHEARSRDRARGGAPSPGPQPGKRPTCGTSAAPGFLSGGAITMADLARQLATIPDVSRFVDDRTGLSGGFDVDLRWTPLSLTGSSVTQSAPSADAGSDGPTIYSALQEQLGLKLAAAKGAVSVLVIDRVERPKGN